MSQAAKQIRPDSWKHLFRKGEAFTLNGFTFHVATIGHRALILHRGLAKGQSSASPQADAVTPTHKTCWGGGSHQKQMSHYKNGRLANDGDPVIGLFGWPQRLRAGTVHDIVPNNDACNCNVTTVVPGTVQVVQSVQTKDLYHAQDAYDAIEAATAKAKADADAVAAEAAANTNANAGTEAAPVSGS